MAGTTADYGKCFILTADVNLAGVILTPVGNSSKNFTGVFDGNYHTIRNIYISLFGYVGSAGRICNLSVEDINITATNSITGGLAGVNYGNIADCYATGTITITGFSEYSNGGLVGTNYGIINGCYAIATVTGGRNVGGLVGYNSGSISDCYADGTVSGFDFNIGGLVGGNNGTITNCYANSAVSGGRYVGGLVGNNYDGIITNCYVRGAVSGSDYVGGSVGSNPDGIIYASFWDVNTSGQTTSAGGIGLTTSQMKSVATYQNAGWADNGWVINDGADYPHLAWENTGGVPIPQPPPIPLSGSGTEQYPYRISTVDDFALLNQYISVFDKHITLMADLDLSGITFYPIGYNMRAFTGVFEGNGHVIRNMNINMPGSNYIGLFAYVNTGGQFRNLRIENVNIIGASYVGSLAGMSDGNIINCYAIGMVTGSGDYVGGLVGENYQGIITNCYAMGTVNGGDYIGGLVGKNDGDINNCYAMSAVIAGCDAGGLVGMNSGRMTTCYTTRGIVKGESCGDIGGLVGLNSGDIIDCYSTDTTNGWNGVGGLVGENDGSINDCYAAGAVNGCVCAGGLVGWNYHGTVNDCYATGAVGNECGGGVEYVGGLVGYNYQDLGITTASFWDVNISGWTTSAGGTGLSTLQMKQQDSFVGWDFTNVWHICEDTNYPKLIWQILPGDIVCPDGVDFLDLAELCEQWLFENIPADLAPPAGDGIVNFADFAVFAGQGGVSKDIYALNDFAEQWLKVGLRRCSADIDYSGTVDFADFAILASHWLEGVTP